MDKLKRKFFPTLLIIISIFSFSSCSKKASEALLSDDLIISASSLNCSSRRIIDIGTKGTVAATARGLYSSVAMIPSTSFPAIAYVDQGSNVLKFAYFNGYGYQIEVISGDSAASFVKLAFLQDGTPLVFWTQGTYVKGAVRSASVTSSANASWSASIIENITGGSPRALEVSVNPLDQVALSYATAATSGGIKFAYCSSSCNQLGNYVTMGSATYVDSGVNTATNIISTGIGWCKANSTTYYPAISYSTSASSVKFSICQNSLSSCGVTAGWSSNQVNVATGLTSNTGSTLILDSSIQDDVPKVALNSSSGIRAFAMGTGTTACTAAATSFSANATITTASANIGNYFFNILKDSLGKFHLVANNTTTNIYYYNSQSTNFTGSWNTVGTIDTVTLTAGQVGQAAIDNSTQGIYIAYGINATPYDLRLTRIHDYTVASNSASLKYNYSSPDLTGGMLLNTTHYKSISVASTSSNRIGVAYVDFSLGAANTARLKYAYRSNNSSDSSWIINIIPDTQSPQYPSLAFDENNRPWILYYDATINRFVLVTNSQTDGTGNWTSFIVPYIPSGAPSALPAANNTSLSMYQNSGTLSPVLIFIDTNTTSKGIYATKFNKTSKTFTVPFKFATLSGTAANLSSAYNSNGEIIVGYEDLTLTSAYYSYSNDGGITWTTPLNVSSSGQGKGLSIAINPANNSPAISFYDKTNNQVYYRTCNNTLSNCATSGWSQTLVDSNIGISTLAAANEQLLQTKLLFLNDGTPIILYEQGVLGNGHLMMAIKTSSSFSTSIFSSGVNGSLLGLNPYNYGISGWLVSAAKNSLGYPTAVYLGPGNYLYSTSCGD
jgi:hypothetical protein